MKLGFIELNVNDSLDVNIKKIKDQLCSDKCDILVIPSKTFCTHINVKQMSLKESLHLIKSSDNTIKEISKEFNCAIIYGSISFDGLCFYKSIKVYDSGNYIDEYHALHIFDDERNRYIKGIEVKILQIRGLKIGLQMGLDIYFPNISNRYATSNVNLNIMFDACSKDKTLAIAKVRCIETLTPTLIINNRDDNSNDFSCLLDKYGECVISTNKNDIFKCLDFNLDNKKTLKNCKDFYREWLSFLS